MKPRLKTWIMAALLGGVVVAVTWTVRQTRAAAAAQAEVQAARTLRARLATRLAQLEQANPVPDSQPAEKPAPVLRVPETISADNVRLRRTRPAEKPDAWTAIMDDPALQNLYLTAERASLAGRYAPVFGAWPLTPAQAEKLQELILRRNEQRMDLEDVMRTSRLGERDPAIARLWDRTSQTFRTEMVGLLGNQAYEDFQNYERALPVWDLVNRFAGAAALQGEPLSGAQAGQLSETLVAASPPYQGGGNADINQIDWPEVVTESATILTQPQQLLFSNVAPGYWLPHTVPVADPDAG